jgi:hypothetical protein
MVAELQHRGRAHLDAERLCSIDTQSMSLRSPSEPSSLTRNVRTVKSEMPFTPPGASGVLAPHDENLRAEQLERTVALRLGTRAHQR